MGLNEISEFDMDKKIVEYAIQEGDTAPLANMTLIGFNDELASESPAPGGGSVAALVGSLAASLAAMVGNLTHGKFEYEDVWDEVEASGIKGQELKARLLHAIDADTFAFNAVMAANRLPDKSDEQAAVKSKAVDDANKTATLIPFSVCEDSLACFDLIDVVASKGNPNSVSDAGVAAFCAYTAVHGAALNVRINLSGIADSQWAAQKRAEVQQITEDADRRLQIVRDQVDKVLATQQ